jgi:hypothetical protein
MDTDHHICDWLIRGEQLLFTHWLSQVSQGYMYILLLSKRKKYIYRYILGILGIANG